MRLKVGDGGLDRGLRLEILAIPAQDQVPHRLGLRQVDTPGKKGPLREFPGLGQPCS